MYQTRGDIQLSLFEDEVAPCPPDPQEVELLGELAYCAGCHEWWPADDEFFSKRCKKCRACMDEDRRANGLKPCIVPGCDQPRATWRVSRCVGHLKEQNDARKEAKGHGCHDFTQAAG